jgi:uncharacterized membrane protein YbhN (UPF0104 family)
LKDGKFFGAKEFATFITWAFEQWKAVTQVFHVKTRAKTPRTKTLKKNGFQAQRILMVSYFSLFHNYSCSYLSHLSVFFSILSGPVNDHDWWTKTPSHS